MFRILIYCLFFVFPVFSDNLNVSLTQKCEQMDCKPRTWYAIDSFDPSFLTLSEIDKSWKEITQFPIWLNKFFTKDGSLATYSLATNFDLPQELLSHKEQIGIRFGEIGEVFEIYINGNLIAKEGIIENDKVSFHRTVRGKVWQVPKEYLKETNNIVLVKISGHPKFDHTGFYLTKYYDIGLADALKYDEQDRISLALIGIYFVVGLYHIFLYFRRRVENYNFYYGAFAVIVSLYMYTRTSAIFEFDWDTALIQRFEFAILFPGVAFFVKSLDSLLLNNVNKWSRYYGYFSYSLCGLTLVTPEMYLAEYILRLWQVSVLLCVLPLLIRIFYIAIKNKVSNAKRLFIGMVVFVLSAIYDIVDSAFLNTGLAFSKYTFMMYILGFAAVLADRFISIHIEIEELNENLEKKVELRTQELSTSLDQIKNLKDQQDGDYFLTSLLLHPLGANQARSQEVKVEFLVKQKKKFQFKEWKSEIGGDLCRSQTLYFKNRPVTVFLNADAMGKSMQGAGGALVAGAVFNSILERTMLSSTVQNQYPEKWLKNSFVEMHKVFESFDGSMLISVVMGVIDNTTGLLYFINAEHPYTVLYRDGETSFIGHEKLYRKLGSSMVDDFISIQTFQLKHGDVIINGSDGRDDLMIEDKTENKKILNYDEKIFLSVVKKGEGEINKIYDKLVETGEFTDDLSLVRIEYRGNNLAIESFDETEIPDVEVSFKANTREALESIDAHLAEFKNSDSKNLRALKYIIVGYIRLKKFKTAIDLAFEYLEIIPADTEVIYYLSYSFRKDKQFLQAIEEGERVRIRNPHHSKNLINLARSYASLGNFSRAKEIILLAIQINPEDLKSIRLQMQIEKAIRAQS
ncbi:MAG TPA: SpoIIE family protein phosphatase [Leptospiraceae bacterium]|nr:SpoIIE family protein phosphatase [Leptospiraceae bacterium]HMW07333.1 SpoIIE family protein phosphatase [Leptospiraceae bacterium]HMX33393.1 SpoIIE family protein phosphatase [Leptospiraceae bacterium]HMY32959.1 SpoIIE family protein phosphatase [Leptospiraceae bacterium]HMZ64573.1 SpoIIE family protein phosphatase [Leptospiraceae bacterium]